MKLVKLNDAEKFNNSDKCEVLEYPLNDPDIDCATAVITSRYHDKGYCVNEKCKELIYVIEGSGTLNRKDEKGTQSHKIVDIKLSAIFLLPIMAQKEYLESN